MDATADTDLLEAFIPDIQIRRIDVAAPFETIIQTADMPFGKRWIVPNDDDDEFSIEKKLKRRQKLAWTIETLTTSKNTPALITYKGLEAVMLSEGLIVSNMMTNHFGATAGKDGMRNVPLLIIVGRPEAAPFDAERLAKAIWFDSPDPIVITNAYDEINDCRWLKDGQALRCQRRAHIDPRVDAVRRQITTAELIQANRTRGVQRSKDNPVTIIYITNEPLPFPIDQVIESNDLWPKKIDVAAARGIIPVNCSDASKIFPDLWKDQKAARNDRERVGWSEDCLNSYIDNHYIRGEAVLGVFEYQKVGKGQKMGRVIMKNNAPGEARSLLEFHLGRLTIFNILSSTGTLRKDPLNP